MADVIKSLGIEHVASNPGNLFRGLHESLVNYLNIDWHTYTHEESSVAMATGYAKIEGKPLLTLAHGTVGLQHASMANAMPPYTTVVLSDRDLTDIYTYLLTIPPLPDPKAAAILDH
jgi:thiamine pyrophosphate-dependent acetolactate synthase large subunit-like protein